MKHIIVLVFLALTFISCDPNRVYEDNRELPDAVWNASSHVAFEVDINDVQSLHNVYINVRNADQYPYSNLYLFVHTLYPNGQKFTDTIECILADAKGKWLGSGLGDLWDNQIPFKRNVKFPVTGKYKFEFEQAMRIKDLPLIVDVGLRIEKQVQGK